MAVRLVITFHAASGKGVELAQAMKARCEVSRQDAGCEQFEVFQSVSDPDKLVLLELWKDQAALDAHANCRRSARLCRRGCGSAPASARTIPTTVPAERGRRQNAGRCFCLPPGSDPICSRRSGARQRRPRRSLSRQSRDRPQARRSCARVSASSNPPPGILTGLVDSCSMPSPSSEIAAIR